MFRSPLSLDRSNRLLTLVVGGLMVVVSSALFLALSSPARFGSVPLLAVMALSFALAPRALVVESGEMRIERRLWPALRVPLADVESAAPIDSLGPRTVRLYGVGGFFGSYGIFSSEKLGRFRLYATRGGQALIVVRKSTGLPIVITPDDVAGAIDAIDRRPRVVRVRAS